MLHTSGEPSVSVIVATYNRADLLPRAIEAIRAQTWQDYEIIVVDDGSADATPDVVAGLAGDRLRSIRHERNLGIGAAYNTGITAASAPLVAFHDHDDQARPDWLAMLIEACTSAPNIGMAWGRFRAHDVVAGTSAIMYRDPFKGDFSSLLPTMLTWTPGTTGLLVRREVFTSIGLLDPEMGALADLDLAIRFAVDGRYSVRSVPSVVFDYYTHGHNASGGGTERYLEQLEHLIAVHSQTFARHPCVNAQYLYWLARMKDSLGRPGAAKLYAEAVRYCPGNLRYRVYPLIKRFGLLGAWSWAGKGRTRVRGMIRDLRHPG